MAISKDDVRRVAQLARIRLTDGQVEKFEKELGGNLDCVGQLNEVDTSDIEPTAQVTGLVHITRSDDPAASMNVSPDALLACSPNLDIESNSVKVPNVF